MIRVLHLVPTGHVGGVETFVYDLARHLDPDRVRVGVCSLAGEGPMLDRIRDTGAECFSIDVRRGIAPRAAWTYLTRLRRGRFDIVHANAGGRKLKRLARWSGCRVVSHCHGYPFDRPTNAATARELQRTYRAASDWLVFSCAWLRDRFEEHGPAWADRSSVIHCGVDASRFCDVPEEARRALRAGLGVPSDRPVVGFVGRFTDQKGLPWLFAAAKSLLAADPKRTFSSSATGRYGPMSMRRSRRSVVRISPWRAHDPRSNVACRSWMWSCFRATGRPRRSSFSKRWPRNGRSLPMMSVALAKRC
jgi:glycosyltransferase involved in cell wall biosynthesis